MCKNQTNSKKKTESKAIECRCRVRSKGFSAEAQQVEEHSRLNTAAYRGPLDHYSGLISDGSLREDEHQRAVLVKLEQLHKTLKGYSNTPTSIFSKVELLNQRVREFSNLNTTLPLVKEQRLSKKKKSLLSCK